MSNLKRDIGSASALFAFEAAARLNSFSDAATELNVTQAAISKQIKGLERHLGRPLFERLHRSIALTDAGRDLQRAVGAGLGSMAATMRRLSTEHTTPPTIALSMALSQFWLMPALPAFTQANPTLPIRVLSQDEDVDLSAGGVDMAIRFGAGDWTDGQVTPLFRGRIRAMAAPSLIARCAMQQPEDVLSAPLLQYDTPDASWIEWQDWLTAAGLPDRALTPALSFARIQDAMLAGISGQGVVLAWEGFGGDLDNDHPNLLPVPGPVILPDGAFYLVSQHELRPAARPLVDWLCSAARGAAPARR